MTLHHWSSENPRCECHEVRCLSHSGERCQFEAEGAILLGQGSTKSPWQADMCAGCAAICFDTFDFTSFKWTLFESHSGRCKFDANLRCEVCGAGFPGYHSTFDENGNEEAL